MSEKEVKNIRSGLVKLLKNRKQYSKETDDMLIDSLIFNLKLIEESKKDIATRGTMIDIGKTTPYYQLNFSIGVFHNAVKSLNSILKQLGLEKEKLENIADDPMTDFNKLLNS